MTDKQIDINNQVEVGLNIAKELLELHKMFEDEVEKNPYVIQTDFIKYKLFYFYQRADWLNVCFNLLDKQLQAKEQECERLREQLAEMISQSALLPKFFGLTADEITNMLNQLNQLKTCLTEIKEIAKGIAKSTYDSYPYGGDVATWEAQRAKQILQKISECEVVNDRNE